MFNKAQDMAYCESKVHTGGGSTKSALGKGRRMKTV